MGDPEMSPMCHIAIALMFLLCLLPLWFPLVVHLLQ